MPRFLPYIIVVLASFGAERFAHGEVFELATGGRLSGKLLNPEEKPRENYDIQIDDRAHVTLRADQVREVSHQRTDLDEYESVRGDYPDTAEGQWNLAEWCRENHLPKQRETHLERVIELDPDHKLARRALGYTKIDGQWATQQDAMSQRGYVRYKGQWKTQQEIDILESKAKDEETQKDWLIKVKRWRAWLDKERADQARQEFAAIKDPTAAKAIGNLLRDDGSLEVRIMAAEILARIGSPDALMSLATAAIEDKDEEVRQSCLDHLSKTRSSKVTGYFTSKLKHKDNRIVLLAGTALGRIKDPESVEALIYALVTTHRYKIVKQGGDNSTSTSFGGGGGSGGSGLSAGSGPRFFTKQLTNSTVLDALVAITGQNYDYDQTAWKKWYAMQKKAEAVGPRRDGT